MLSALITSAASVSFSQETLRVTTYYPSPIGEYSQLRLNPRDTVPLCIPGTMYVDIGGNLQFCSGTGEEGDWGSPGFWSESATPGTYSIRPTDLDYKVGIGIDEFIGKFAVYDEESSVMMNFGADLYTPEDNGIMITGPGRMGFWAMSDSEPAGMYFKSGENKDGAIFVSQDVHWITPATGNIVIKSWEDNNIPILLAPGEDPLVLVRGHDHRITLGDNRTYWTPNAVVGIRDEDVKIHMGKGASGGPGHTALFVENGNIWAQKDSVASLILSDSVGIDTTWLSNVIDGTKLKSKGTIWLTPSLTTVATITGDGYFGINNTTPSHALDVTGNGNFTGDLNIDKGLTVNGMNPSGFGIEVFNNSYFYGSVTATEFLTPSSDIRWKKNIGPISSALDKITKIRGISFEWKKDEFPEKGFKEGQRFGLVAQEIESVIPELVSTDEDGYKYIDYDQVLPILIEAIKEQQKQINELKKQINSK